ncbi:MAG: YicC family protein [Flavobacteriales bacterium]|nr:YicC family protein [Flavobacteriales bacterium]MBK8948004.1 YicC family protein [Flavobacteriales bacterium]MBK9699951.1 YicC family protein [Flavobacteriales bacterium]
MLRSMTGFGRAEGTVGERKASVELRSLNSKQLDLLVKLPAAHREREAELRAWLAERVVRGKVELFVNIDPVRAADRTGLDATVVKAQYDQLKALADAVAPGHSTDLLGIVLRQAEQSRPMDEPTDPAEWEALLALVHQAAEAFTGFRAEEGARLMEDLRSTVGRVAALLAEVEQLDAGRTDRVRDRLRSKVEELGVTMDRNRFEQELVYYLEKFDINEEKVRLKAHCAYFLETLAAPDQQGRKLGFIAQEMGREMNTIGSKANDAILQKLVVRMKDDLEKIKEQLLNVL